MYVRTIKRKNKDGSQVEYVQLANNVWNKDNGFAQAQVIYSFGRRDQLDVDAQKRLVKSLSRFLKPEDVIELEHQAEDLKFVSSRPAGGASHRRRPKVEVHRLEIHKASGQKAAGAYRKGCEGRQVE